MKQLNKEKTLGASSVAEEALFNRLLSLECRRCERTGMPFALVLLGLNRLKDILSPSAMRAIASSLSAAMRETDVTGWYENARCNRLVRERIHHRHHLDDIKWHGAAHSRIRRSAKSTDGPR